MAENRSRDLEDLVQALERHLRLLHEYARRAFQDGDFDYGGEVAGKLRLLVTKFGSNRPLLLDLMAETGINPLITLGGPPIEPPPGEPRPGDKISLSLYLQLGAIGIRVPSGEFVMLNKTQLIRAWAEQTGSSHEDWSLDPPLEAILRAPIYIGGLHGAFAELRITTEPVLHVADRFLTEFRSLPKGSDENA
ncbi:MAG: hypothetical protein HYT78_15965 [Deltaproteobacteria bacterium]|nr:hypothetical protein [Deltaproteobacteria bacterium]